ncbi:hypothetical protein K439DRAFT_1617337 [Ramaria rubella]|nr:hypothetical protein K439DRAFT_1617337 [Ramaria rubella]
MNNHNMETPTNINSLPPELFTHILLHCDFPHDIWRPSRKACLQACSLTCRAWVVPSHRLLFDSFTIFTLTSGFLLELVPNIVHYVKSLTITHVITDAISLPSSFWKILPMFQNVRTLTINPLYAYEDLQFSLVANPKLLNSFPFIEKLVLKRCTLESLRIVFPMLGSHQHLQSLEVQERRKPIISVGNHMRPLDFSSVAVTTDNTTPPKLNRLQQLTVWGLNSHPVLVWMSSYTTVHLTHISVINITQRDVRPLAALLKITGPSLHHLLLHFLPARNDSLEIKSVEQVQELSISHNTALHSLQLRNLTWLPSVFATCVPNLLAQISSTTVDSIIFDLSFYPETSFKRTAVLKIVPFERVDGILTSSKFQDLRRVTFEVFIKSSESKEKKMMSTIRDIKTRMKSLQNEGRLFVVHGQYGDDFDHYGKCKSYYEEG